MKKTTLLSLGCIAIAAISCQKTTPLTVEPSSITIYSDGTHQITATPSDGVTYTSADEFYAKVDASGLVTANKVGKTQIIVSSSNGSATIPVTVLPKYSVYPDLDPIVGSPLSTMTSLLGTNYTEGTSSSGATTYTYKNYNTYTYSIIAFFSNGVCTQIGVVVPTTYLTIFVNYLKERYLVAGTQNDYYFFLNHDKNVIVTMGLYNTSYMIALYTPYSGTKASIENIPTDILNSIL